MHHSLWLALGPATLCKHHFGDLFPAIGSECAAVLCRTLTGQRGHMAAGSGLTRALLSLPSLFWPHCFPAVSLTPQHQTMAPLASHMGASGSSQGVTSSGDRDYMAPGSWMAPSLSPHAPSGAGTGLQEGSSFGQRHCFSHPCAEKEEALMEPQDLSL